MTFERELVFQPHRRKPLSKFINTGGYPMTTEYAKQAGDYLPNGALLLMEYVYNITHYEDTGNHRIESFVLCLNKGAVQPWVTWSRWVTVDEHYMVLTEDTCWGHYFKSVVDALADFDERVENKTGAKEKETNIRERGSDDGKTAASWIVDGNTDNPFEVLSKIIQGIEDGDPAVLDQLPSPSLGGEWADNPTWEEILREESGGDPNDSTTDLLWDAYHEGFEKGMMEELHRMKDAYDPATNYGTY